MNMRLTSVQDVTEGVQTPSYQPDQHGVGIVHLGVGAFHKAHQAVYTDDALGATGGDWRIVGVSLRSPTAAEELNPQNGLYTLIERADPKSSARLIGSIAEVIALQGDTKPLLDLLSKPDIRIVSLTVTEKAYGIERSTGRADLEHPAVASDLKAPDNPVGALGILVTALAKRRAMNIPPFTVLCCDNLPENGKFLRDGVIDFATRQDPKLGRWIAENVAFPSTMVDRITPAKTDVTLNDAAAMTGCTDLAAIETEPFSQWVIEDHFPTGRPNWEAGGALFVADVAPYENMKLRMLNGAHTMLAYAGFLSGRRFVSDVMADENLAVLVRRHLAAAANTLDPLDGMDLAAYADSLVARFENPTIAHQTYQIAMDGSEKLPQRIIAPALSAIERGQSLAPFAFVVAVWMRYCQGVDDTGETYDLRDPRQAQITDRLKNVTSPADIVNALFGLTEIFPEELVSNRDFRGLVESDLTALLQNGVSSTIKDLAELVKAEAE